MKFEEVCFWYALFYSFYMIILCVFCFFMSIVGIDYKNNAMFLYLFKATLIGFLFWIGALPIGLVETDEWGKDEKSQRIFTETKKKYELER